METMRIIELAVSILNVSAIWMLRYQKILLGCIFGAAGEFGWIVMFWYTGQYGIILMEVTIFCIYAECLWRHYRRKYAHQS